jgi:hypothetical protein
MEERGYQGNTMTIMLLLGACNWKGRGLSDVAMVLYAKLASAHKGDIPVVIKSQLVEVWPMHRVCWSMLHDMPSIYLIPEQRRGSSIV